MQQVQETDSHQKQKRKLKTPAQVEALEKFYNGTAADFFVVEFIRENVGNILSKFH